MLPERPLILLSNPDRDVGKNTLKSTDLALIVTFVWTI